MATKPKATTTDDKLPDVTFDDNMVLKLEDMVQAEPVRRPALPGGTYDAIVMEVMFEESKKGNPQMHWVLQTQDEENEDNHGYYLHYYTVLNSKNGQERFASALARVNPEIDLAAVKPADVEGDVIDRPCRVRVGVQRWEGRKTNNVRDILAPSDADGGWLDK